MARKLFAQIFLPLAGISVLSAILFGALAITTMDRLYGESTADNLEAAAASLAATLPVDIEAATKDWIARAATASPWRITLVRADGKVLGDSAADPATMENHASRQEIAKALAGKTSSARRRSTTIGRELFYAAAPVRRDGRIVGAIRLAADLPSIEARLRPKQGAMALAFLAVVAASIFAAAFFSRRIAKPLHLLAGISRAVAQGDRSQPIPVLGGPEEVVVLAQGLALMAEELDRRVRDAKAEGRERSAILDGMAEAVIALDRDCRVRVANPAASVLFALVADEALGKPLLELARSPELQTAAETCIASGQSLETELAMYRDGERWFQVFVTPMHNETGSSGAVIVLNDITRLRRLERVRKDFVANVSHELRTPIHLIKGFAEALDEGAIDDSVQARRFLGIMASNAARMESLIDDLLTLARLEQEGGDWLTCADCQLEGLLDEAVEAVLPKAEDKDISILQSCAQGLEARVNASLLVQAVVNLLDNAVKYSPRGSKVRLSANPSGSAAEGEGPESVCIVIADNGIGIPAKDLPRIFERFYRVDKARSKQLGGTGLGLAIVRHIALAHGGSVAVESVAGEGTRFSLTLPLSGPDITSAS